eukprot:TRINITY_DN6536_c0_g2_i2.p1 TRINITY_DN6536_c0_g2~~TRINITY_DN6536_c0_g2_i2.p1  ORF type:complete len:277 (+),score=39.51 TRINITY_DN6536_c0_g2_i2:381-1211(+)
MAYVVRGLGLAAVVGGFGLQAIFILLLFLGRLRLKYWQASSKSPRQGCLNRTFRFLVSFFGLESDTAEESVQSLIETVKLVSLFLLALAPDEMLQYTCGVHPELSHYDHFGFFIELRYIPCPEDEAVGSDYYLDFVASLNFSNSEMRMFHRMTDAMCVGYNYGFFFIVIMYEALTLLYLTTHRQQLFPRALSNTIMLVVPSMLYAAWIVLHRIEYTDGYECTLRYATLTCLVMSVLYSILSLMVGMAYLNGKARNSTRSSISPAPPTEVTSFETQD